MKNIIKKSFYVGVVLSIFLGVISCEKDFTDIGTGIINNTKFSNGEILLDINVENSPLEKVKSDNIAFAQGQYLLGVYASPDYEKIESSIISQVIISKDSLLVDKVYGADTTVVTTIDAVFIKLPYQATLVENTTTGPDYTLDSIIGDKTKPFNINVYQINDYLSRLNPADPSKLNSYFSNDPYQKIGTELNEVLNYQFTPSKNDTVLYVNRRLSNNNIYDQDTVKYLSSAGISTPFINIPLNKDKFKELFLDKLESNEFASQDAFNNYFRGLVIEATGDEGFLVSLNFNNTTVQLNPTIEVYFTNTVLKSGVVVDSIKKNNTFSLSGIRRNSFKMTDRTYPVNQEVKIQGAAGSEAKINLFAAGKLEELRAKNLLVNEASITFYIDQSKDTTAVPNRLYLYKSGENTNSNPNLSQIKDTYSEGESTFGGLLERDNGKKDRYTFRITDYVSDLLSGETSYSPPLKLKVYNSTDLPVTDSIFVNYSWNPKAVTILNESASNGSRKAQLKITYSEKKD